MVLACKADSNLLWCFENYGFQVLLTHGGTEMGEGPRMEAKAVLGVIIRLSPKIRGFI